MDFRDFLNDQYLFELDLLIILTDLNIDSTLLSF